LIVLNKFNDGRMGNILFHYNLVFQLSKKLQTDFFIKTYNNFEIFDLPQNSNKTFSLFRKKIYQNLENCISPKKDYLLCGTYLGEQYSKYTLYNPKDFFKFKKELIPIECASIKVAIHFRGTDFLTWNPDSILSSEYYSIAINRVLDTYDNVYFTIFTDDDNLKSLNDSIDHLKNKKANYKISNNTFEVDFLNMSYSDIIISSPSTFAIWASILGRPKKCIFHSLNWVKNRVANNDKFWIDLYEKKLPFHCENTILI
jgi:hypothetical protein